MKRIDAFKKQLSYGVMSMFVNPMTLKKSANVAFLEEVIRRSDELRDILVKGTKIVGIEVEYSMVFITKSKSPFIALDIRNDYPRVRIVASNEVVLFADSLPGFIEANDDVEFTGNLAVMMACTLISEIQREAQDRLNFLNEEVCA